MSGGCVIFTLFASSSFTIHRGCPDNNDNGHRWHRCFWRHVRAIVSATISLWFHHVCVSSCWPLPHEYGHRVRPCLVFVSIGSDSNSVEGLLPSHLDATIVSALPRMALPGVCHLRLSAAMPKHLELVYILPVCPGQLPVLSNTDSIGLLDNINQQSQQVWRSDKWQRTYRQCRERSIAARLVVRGATTSVVDNHDTPKPTKPWL